MSKAPRISGTRLPVRPLSAEELARLAAACAGEYPESAPDHAILLLLTTTGLRSRELCALAVDQLYEGYLTVPTVKTGQDREIRLPLETERHVRSYVSRFRKPYRDHEQALFLTQDGQPLDSAALERIVCAAASRAELAARHVTIALIRYSVATLLFDVL